MMKILFLSESVPIGFNFTGASSFITSHLSIISQLNMPKEIIVIRIPAHANAAEPDFKELSNPDFVSVKQVPFIFTQNTSSLLNTFLHFVSSTKRIRRESSLFPVINPENVALLQSIIDQEKPHIVWSEHQIPLLLASRVNFQGRLIYSHHDFIWKLQLIRRKRIKDWIMAWMLRRIQTDVVKRVKWIVGGAKNELTELSFLSPKSHTFFLPTIYPRQKRVNHTESDSVLRIVHLGTLRATANRIGLKILLKNILPLLTEREIDYECWLIGDLSTTDTELEQLMKHPNVYCKGYIQDLNEVLLANDVHIIPYDHATGTRTRMTLALNHQQLLLAHKNSVEGFDGLVDGINCLLGSNLQEMVDKLETISLNNSEKRKIALAGKKWYDENFREDVYAQQLGEWLGSPA